MDIFEKCYKPQPQEKIKDMGIYPFFKPLESRQDIEVIMEGKRRIMLGSNNYLGLTVHPEVVEVGAHIYGNLLQVTGISRWIYGRF